jgi:hypothetical protein
MRFVSTGRSTRSEDDRAGAAVRRVRRRRQVEDAAGTLTIKLTRQLCREFKEKQPNAAELRIRRAKLTLFDS